MWYISKIEVSTPLVGRVNGGMKYCSGIDLKNIFTWSFVFN